MACCGYVTYEVDEEGHKVEVEFQGIKLVNFGEEGMWDSMFQRHKSENCQNQEMKAEADTCSLVELVSSVKKLCWANIKRTQK